MDVDRKTFKRTPKPSARLYKEIIETNGLSGEMVCRYLEGFPSKYTERK